MKKAYIIILVISIVMSGLYVGFAVSLGDISPDPPRQIPITFEDVAFDFGVFVMFSGGLFCVISLIYWIICKLK